MWQVTRDRWHMTGDKWHMTGDRRQVWVLWCFEDLEEKDNSVTQLMNDDAVCRTALATPGLLNTYEI